MDRFTMSPDPAQAGQQLQICFSNSSLANTTVTIGLHNGLAPGEQGYHGDSIEIDLDASGNGCVKWPVPASGWASVVATHATSDDHGIPVV